MIESLPLTELYKSSVMAALLVALGVFAFVFQTVAWGAIGLVARGLVTLGLYDPTQQRETVSPVSRDRGVLLFTEILRVVSRVLPGEDPVAKPRLVILPLLLVGVPIVILLLLLFVVAPAYLFAFVLANGPAPWSFPLALSCVFAQFLGFTVLRRLGRKLPRMETPTLS